MAWCSTAIGNIDWLASDCRPRGWSVWVGRARRRKADSTHNINININIGINITINVKRWRLP
jgi:hypothetical protein